MQPEPRNAKRPSPSPSQGRRRSEPHRLAVLTRCTIAIAIAILSIAGCRRSANEPRPSSSTTSSPAATAATNQCDELAAHPEDPARTAPGVTDDDLLPEAAIDACVGAIKHDPGIARFYFQLGRAYWADDETDDAVGSFLKAEELGYAPAYYYLALAFEQGLVPDEPEDADAAEDMFLLAATKGFPPAARAYEDGER